MSLYQAHGKFLLTGEYLVLRGALALALPLKLGQTMSVETVCTPSLQWDAHKPDGHWFSVTLDPENLEIIHCTDQNKAEKLAHILQAFKSLNPNAFKGNGLKFTTRLDFDPNWGLGSSSTLIANLAQWADVNPYELLKLTFGGSGYDIACATAEGPIYYQLIEKESDCLDCFVPRNDAKRPSELIQKIEPAYFQPSFVEHLFFVYQGQKQNSSKEVKAFLEKTNPIDLQKDIEAVSEISRAVPKCESLDEFGLLMQCHERIIARCIGQEPVQKRFPNFEGTLKSLGAWGGDFLLAATRWDEKQVRKYFQTHGIETAFRYNDLIKKEGKSSIPDL